MSWSGRRLKINLSIVPKWIDGADTSREREKLNLGFCHDSATKSLHYSENETELLILT